MTFLLDGIKCNTIDSVISFVLGGSALADFESTQLMIAEHIPMLTERSKFSNRNVLATYAARDPRSGRGDCGRGDRGGSGGRSGGAGIITGEWDKRGIDNGNHDFVVHKLNNIGKCWYHDPEYQKMNLI